MSVEDFAKKKNDLEAQKAEAEAEASFDGEKVGELETALADLEKSRLAFEAKIETPAEEMGAATENQEKQIVEQGGTLEVVAEKTAEIDEKIEEKKEEAVEVVKEKTETVSQEEVVQSNPESKEEPLNLEELKGKVRESQEWIANNPTTPPSEKLEIYKTLGNTAEVNKHNEYLAKDYESRGFSDWAADHYSELGDKEKAKELWEKSAREAKLTDDPQYSGNYYSTANIYEKLGDVGKATELRKKYIEINQAASGGDKNYSGMADVYEKLGDTENAKAMWEEQAKKWGDSSAEKAGEAYEKAGNKEKAEESYKKAIAYQEDLRTKGSSAFDSERLAKAYIGIGEKTKALQMLRDNAENIAKHGHNYQYEYNKLGKYLN